MKKNKALTAAISVLSLTMVSLCAIGGTFAKYTTTDTDTDTAKVAKWGVTVEVNADEAKSFEHIDGNNVDEHVSGVSSVDLLAPGTKGNLIDVTISGQPEVDVLITYDADLTLSGWQVGGVDYVPLIIYVNSTECKSDTMAGLENAVETAINSYTRSYDANTDLSGVSNEELVVTWVWAYTGTDTKDTALGNAAADGNAPTIELEVTTTVTQVD